MRTLSLFFLTALFVSGFSSCIRENPYADKIRTLDSLYLTLDTLKSEMGKIDPEEAALTYEEIMRNLDFVKKGLKDSADKETGFLMSDYRVIRKPYKQIKENHKKLSEELDFSQLQLFNLTKDLKKQLPDSALAEEYFLSEYKAAASVSQHVRRLLMNYHSANENFRELHPKVQELIEKRIITEVNQ
jgi:hypothetical protein